MMARNPKKTGHDIILMTSGNDNKDAKAPPPKRDGTGRKAAAPEWAHGLRQLYDSVVDEELPTSFTDLLSRLDQKD